MSPRHFIGLLRSAFCNRPAASEPSSAPALEPCEPPDGGLQEHVRYAIGVGQNYLTQLEGAGMVPDGARILELGPGSDFGPALILASHGARVTIADRFMADQNPDHHRRLNARLLELWPGPNEAIRQAVSAGSYDGVVVLVSAEAESLPCPDGSFDMVLSNAVLEHVADLPTACTELFRVTAPGGFNIHQVDFRDHRDFDRPLEHLLSATDDFEPAAEWIGQFGARRRSSEVERCFLDAGFALESTGVNSEVDETYLDDFMGRLARSDSPYRDWPRDDLKKASALLCLRKPR